MCRISKLLNVAQDVVFGRDHVQSVSITAMDWSETDEDNEDDGSQAGSDAFRDTAQSIGEDEVGEAWTYRYLLRKAKKTISSTGEVQKQKMQRGEQRRRYGRRLSGDCRGGRSRPQAR